MPTHNSRSLRKSLFTRLAVERMEDRYVPAFFTVTGLTDVAGLSPTAGDGSLADPYQVASLRSAVELAQATTADDTITLSAGAYQLTDTMNLDLNIVDVVTGGKLTISGAGEGTTTIQASYGLPGLEGRHFGVAGGGDLTLSNLTLTGGNASNGGAILAYGGGTGTNLTLTNVTLTGNEALSFGGAISVIGDFNGNITATLTNVTVEQNTAGFVGGGITVMYGGNVSINNSSVSDNATMGYGGGVAVYGDYGGTLNISNSTVSGNTAGYGGGIAIFQDMDGATTLTNTTVSGNTADFGGGIMLNYAASTAPLNLVNSTVSGNTAIGYGGGIAFGNAIGALTNSTVTANKGYGGGLANVGGGTDTLAVRNTIVAGNFDPSGNVADDLFAYVGTPFVANYSLIGVGDNGVLDPSSANNLTGTLLNPLDPRLGTLTNNGGPTLTHALLTDSPARNSGDPNATGLPATDQRGAPRVLGTRVDIGATEAQAITISPATLPAGTVGSPYTATLTAAGASGPFAYTVTAGALPPGLTLSPTGELTGTPTAAGTYTFTIGVTGTAMSSGARDFSLTVTSADVPPSPPVAPPKFVLGAGSNGRVQVAGGDGTSIPAFNGFQGEVRVATADLNGDGVLDVIAGAGAGAPGGHIKVFDGRTGAEIRSFFAFDGFAGGVYVSTGDINGDGTPDIIVGAGAGAVGGHIKVLDGRTGAEIRSFFAFDGFAGEARVAAGDTNGDGADEIIVGAGAAGGHIKVFDGRTGALVRSFFAFDGFAGGVFVGAADLDGDGTDEIAAGADAGADPAVRVYGTGDQPVLSFLAYAPTFRGGVRVAGFDVDGDDRDEIVTGSGPGTAGDGRVFDSAGRLLSAQIVPDVLTGIFVG